MIMRWHIDDDDDSINIKHFDLWSVCNTCHSYATSIWPDASHTLLLRTRRLHPIDASHTLSMHTRRLQLSVQPRSCRRNIDAPQGSDNGRMIHLSIIIIIILSLSTASSSSLNIIIIISCYPPVSKKCNSTNMREIEGMRSDEQWWRWW
jgi:hypothetical protein